MSSYIANTDLNQSANKNSLEIIDTNNENFDQLQSDNADTYFYKDPLLKFTFSKHGIIAL